MLSYARPLFGYPHPDPGQGPGIGMGLGYVSGRPTHLQQSGGGSGAVVLPGVINSVPVASSLGQRKVVGILFYYQISEFDLINVIF